MDKEDIIQLIESLDQSTLSELVIEREGFKLALKKPAVQLVTQTTPAVQTITQSKSDSQEVTPLQQTEEIKAPLVGVAYVAPAPNKPAFTAVGQTIQVGDVVCVIEAMKMMHEIISEVAGTVQEICFGNEEIVEFDQPLFIIQK